MEACTNRGCTEARGPKSLMIRLEPGYPPLLTAPHCLTKFHDFWCRPLASPKFDRAGTAHPAGCPLLSLQRVLSVQIARRGLAGPSWLTTSMQNSSVKPYPRRRRDPIDRVDLHLCMFGLRSSTAK